MAILSIIVFLALLVTGFALIIKTNLKSAGHKAEYERERLEELRARRELTELRLAEARAKRLADPKIASPRGASSKSGKPAMDGLPAEFFQDLSKEEVAAALERAAAARTPTN